jgi:HEPN domain-containing protein
MNDPRAEAQRWFRQAQADLAVVQTLKGAGHYAAACFHSQQSAEKALMAVLYLQGRRVVLGNSVRDLIRQCTEIEPKLVELETDGALLDQFYIPTRYPNGLPSPAVPSEMYAASQAETALTAATCVLAAVSACLHPSDGD